MFMEIMTKGFTERELNRSGSIKESRFFQINNHVLAGFRKAPDTHRVNTFDVKPLQTSKRGKEWSLMR